MQQRPDLNQLQKLVIPKIANKWDSIAIQLDFDAVQISNIEENHQELPVETSCQKMLWGWLNSSSNNSNHAKDLIQAVKDVEYICYAEELKTGFKFIIIIIIAPVLLIDTKQCDPHGGPHLKNTPYNKL